MQTGNTRTDVMSLDEFKAWFVAEIDWSPAEISEEDNLVEDLGMDSVGAVDLMAAIEEAVGGRRDHADRAAPPDHDRA